MRRFYLFAALAFGALTVMSFAGCVSEPENLTGDFYVDDSTTYANIDVIQPGWDKFSERLDWAVNKQRNRAILTTDEAELVEDNARDWWEALIIFENLAELRAYDSAGWWDQFVDIALWDADDRGDVLAATEIRDYDSQTRSVLR